MKHWTLHKDINCIGNWQNLQSWINKVKKTRTCRLLTNKWWGLPNRFSVYFGKLNGRATIELNQKGGQKKAMKLLKLEISGQPLPTGGGVHKIEI